MSNKRKKSSALEKEKKQRKNAQLADKTIAALGGGKSRKKNQNVPEDSLVNEGAAAQKKSKVKDKDRAVTAENSWDQGRIAGLSDQKATAFDWIFALIVLIFVLQNPLSLIGVGNYFIYYTPVVLFVIVGLCIWKLLLNRKNKKNRRAKSSEEAEGRSLWKNIFEYLPLLLFGVYAIIMIISTLVNCPNQVTFTALDVRCDGIIPYLGAIAFMLAALSIDSDRLKLCLLRIFIISSSIFNLAYLIKSFKVGGSSASDIGIFINSNHVGYYLAIGTMAAAIYFVFAKKKWEMALALVLEAIGIMALSANNTLGAQLAVALGLVVSVVIILLCRGKSGLRVLIPLGLAVIVFIISSFLPLQNGIGNEDTGDNAAASNATEIAEDISAISSGLSDASGSLGSGRLERWKIGLKYLEDKPLLGYGAEAGSHLTYGSSTADRIHNEYFHFALMYGIPAAIIYILAIFAVFLRGLKYRKKLTGVNIVGLCVAFTYAVSAAVGVVIPFIYPFLFIFLGMGYYRRTE